MKSAIAVCVVLSLVAGLIALTGVSYAATIGTVAVGDPGNLADARGGDYEPNGAVSYTYRIGKYEVTNTQYAEFLTAYDTDGTDPLDLYEVGMQIADDGGGAYSAASGHEQKPLKYTTFWRALRFANWLHNGQPTDGTGTEDGAYTLEGGTATPSNDNTVTRNAGWKWALTSEDEWYKAAYYKGGGTSAGYWDYPTGTDTAPTTEVPPGGANSANFAPSAVGDTSNVGAYTSSASPYGTFDQGGNLTEYTERLYSAASGGTGGSMARGIRGGDWDANDITYLIASKDSWSWAWHDGAGSRQNFGFRVVQIPEPASAVLLLLGLPLLLRRTRR